MCVQERNFFQKDCQSLDQQHSPDKRLLYKLNGHHKYPYTNYETEIKLRIQTKEDNSINNGGSITWLVNYD